ncbi:hypothetical protein V1478_001407 [Vespula squamosa]|uniref:Uncharacterized protein n=1 Tax=Vespula squamosa TaxID=30214 RepID=A0ABD2C1C7_VESSQ
MQGSTEHGSFPSSQSFTLSRISFKDKRFDNDFNEIPAASICETHRMIYINEFLETQRNVLHIEGIEGGSGRYPEWITESDGIAERKALLLYSVATPHHSTTHKARLIGKP